MGGITESERLCHFQKSIAQNVKSRVHDLRWPRSVVLYEVSQPPLFGLEPTVHE